MNNRIRVLRAERSLSQAELARKTGVSRQTISSIEAGRSEPSLSVAFEISEALGVSIEDIFSRTSTKPPWQPTPGSAPPR